MYPHSSHSNWFKGENRGQLLLRKTKSGLFTLLLMIDFFLLNVKTEDRSARGLQPSCHHEPKLHKKGGQVGPVGIISTIHLASA